MSEDEPARRRRQMHDEALIEHELIDEAVSNLSMETSLMVGMNRFTIEEADDPEGPLTIQRDRDGARFEIEYEVRVRALASS